MDWNSLLCKVLFFTKIAVVLYYKDLTFLFFSALEETFLSKMHQRQLTKLAIKLNPGLVIPTIK